MAKSENGWDWFDGEAAGPGAAADREPALAFARCFRGRDGARALSYLRAITLDRALGPDAPDALLRHLEGQRQLVGHIGLLIERGRSHGKER